MKSQYGDRETVGTTYVKSQNKSAEGLEVGDFGPDMVGGLVEDLNDTFQSNPFEGRSFYVNVVEERDLQMKNALKRVPHKTLYRPYPEDNTLVFHVDLKSNRVFYCWDLPHHSEYFNILRGETLYDPEYVKNIRDFASGNLVNFGFMKVTSSGYQVEGYSEDTIRLYRECYYNYCKFLQMDEKSLDAERRFGFFWIPNKFKKDKDITEGNQRKFISIGI